MGPNNMVGKQSRVTGRGRANRCKNGASSVVLGVKTFWSALLKQFLHKLSNQFSSSAIGGGGGFVFANTTAAAAVAKGRVVAVGRHRFFL